MPDMNKTWKPIAAGILEILAGFGILFSALAFFELSYVLTPRPWDELSLSAYGLIRFVTALLWWMIPFIFGLFGIVPLVGGVCALFHRRWGLAFAGAIGTVPLTFIAPFGLGPWANYEYGIALHYFSWLPLLLSIIIITLVILSKREFK